MNRYAANAALPLPRLTEQVLNRNHSTRVPCATLAARSAAHRSYSSWLQSGESAQLVELARHALGFEAVDTFLVVASKREVREYSDRPLPDVAVRRILEAGWIAGSSGNRQQRNFVVVTDPDLRERLSDAVYAPGNIRGAALVVAITVKGRGPVAFDAGRAGQNMMLAAWNEGIGSCPNGMPDSDAVARLLGLEHDERPVIVLTFGYSAHARDPQRRPPEEWIDRADRKPFDEVVRRV